jgi:hypothetical protein
MALAGSLDRADGALQWSPLLREVDRLSLTRIRHGGKDWLVRTAVPRRLSLPYFVMPRSPCRRERSRRLRQNHRSRREIVETFQQEEAKKGAKRVSADGGVRCMKGRARLQRDLAVVQE